MPFAVATVAWPEMVVPAYFAARGLRFYEQVFFDYTPGLIALTAAGGALFGFGGALARGLVGLSLAAAAALLVLGTRRTGWKAGLLAGLPLLLCWCAYLEGPSLWPDPFLAPLPLAAALLLERFEARGSDRPLLLAGLALGLAILVKQQAAWLSLAALLWLALASRRRTPRRLALLVAAFSAPYLAWAALWGAAHGTLAHVRWTLLVPFQIAHLRQNYRPPSPEVLHESIAPFLALLALLLLRRALPAGRRFRSAAPWLALGCWGMAYPRADLTHLSAGLGLYTLLATRSLLLVPVLARRGRTRSPARPRVLALAAGAAALLCAVGVGLLGGGELLLWRAGGPVHYWDDRESLRYEAMARRHVPPGVPLLVVDPRNEMLYVKLGALPPGRLYVNTSFLEFLDKEGVEGRVLEALRRSPGAVVMYREPEEEKALLSTRLYRYVTSETELLARDENVEWRAVPPTSPWPR